MTQHRTGLGLNTGHGFAKIALLTDGHAPITVTVPAVVSPAQRQLAGAIRRVETVSFDRSTWWIGDDALLTRDARSAMTQDRLKDPTFIPVLVKGTLEALARRSNGVQVDQLVPEAYCVSGLPATWSLDRTLAGALAERLRAAAQLGKVKIIAEPLGLLYAALLNNNGEIAGDERLQSGTVAVVDLGHQTVDVAVMERMIPQADALATYELGTARPLHAIQQRLQVTFNVQLSPYQVDQAIRAGRLTLGAIDSPLPHGWDKPLRENAKNIVIKLAEAWSSGLQFDAIIVGGGGAEVPIIAQAIQERFRSNAHVVPEGQMAVALGYARLGRLLARRAAR